MVCKQTTAVHWAALEKRIREICETRVLYVYRRVHFVMQREGWPVNRCLAMHVYMREKGQENLSHLQRDGPSVAQQDTEASRESKAAR